jgi:membrane dipeptidase
VTDLLDTATGPMCATHSNCRVIVGDDPGGRHLPDEAICRLADRNGMIGLNFFRKFLVPAGGNRPATLDDVARHARHIADLTGRPDLIGLGTDMDGGLGREHIPQEIETAADLPKLHPALLAASFTDAEATGILGHNWLRWFRQHLPA